jgi:hypothetical protein
MTAELATVSRSDEKPAISENETSTDEAGMT